LVTAITPTQAGEGKSTISIGLIDGLNKAGYKAVGALREPSMGPVFGLKGGAAGGGYAQMVPMVELNLHFTGDFHAITSAHNLIAAILDNSLYQGNALNIDKDNIVWKRALDVNDRALRHIQVGLGGKTDGVPHANSFQITAASEIMAIICLSSSLANLSERLQKIIVAYTPNGQAITVNQLGIVGSLMALLKDALKPNLIQTLEHNAVFVHGGPFANIAHGCNSVLATQMALSYGDYVVTEAGFASELGAEKFFDIKCRQSGLKPDSVVLVATIRALKQHDPTNFEVGLANLQQHINNIKAFGLKPIVALNCFSDDNEMDITKLNQFCTTLKVKVIPVTAFNNGGDGATNLAQAVVASCLDANNFTFLYENCLTIKQKIEKIATTLYGAQDIAYSPRAEAVLVNFSQDEQNLPICMAKTPTSLSDKVGLMGRPQNFTLNVNNISLRAGAGFVVVFCGNIIDMPGLGASPSAFNINLDSNGQITGLF
jgi:formate--tetrahydrofolate ligase